MKTISASDIAKAMGLRRKITSEADLEEAIEKGLPKSSLGYTVRHAVTDSGEFKSIMDKIVPKATFSRRHALKPEESERVQRLARVVATSRYVWDDEEDSLEFLNKSHPALGGRKPVVAALTEIGARRVEKLLWDIFFGLPV